MEQVHAHTASRVSLAESDGPSTSGCQPIAERVVPHSALEAVDVTLDRTRPEWSWTNALPLLWSNGFSVLLLRLIAARLMLWSTESQGTVVGQSRSPVGDRTPEKSDYPLVVAFHSACQQLRVHQRVKLLIYSDRTIPVVWRILRFRLLLPVAARQWSDAQLRSVLLHELAHIKRSDTVAQLLTQFACALHWFNPLVWFAAWRLHVERERACDDLVLASGVQASAYAEHLLNVATQFSSSPWTQACGLAMARNPSLEDRLAAVLSEKSNRRGVTRTLSAALVVGAAIAIPIAVLHAADKEPVKETKSVQPAVRPAPKNIAKPDAGEAAAAGKPQPKDKNSQALFRKWQAGARIDGRIPGGALGSLATATSNFVKFNPTDERSPKLAEQLKPIDISHDWTQADAVTLLDDVSAVYPNLPSWALEQSRFETAETIRTGHPLPDDLAAAPWGETQPNGLRVAWLLDPPANQHRLNTPLRSRILFHNAGAATVVFRVLTWNQSAGHKAHDANGAELRIYSTSWTTIPQVVACRLAPGEFTEVVGAGIGVGPNRHWEDWRGTRVGSWIHTKEGDDVTFTPSMVSVAGKFMNKDARGDSGWWLEFITNRLNRDMPLPSAAAERKRLLDRAVRDIFGTAPTPEETAAFVAVRTPDAMGTLTNHLARRTGFTPFTGKLQSGKTRFRVLAVDPDAANKPRVATGPGRYIIGDHVRLVIVGKSDGKRRISEANIRFFPSKPKTEPPGKPHEIKLPYGLRTWAIAWERGSTVLWVAEKGVLRSHDFADPAQVIVTRLEADEVTNVAKPLLKALRPAFEPAAESQPEAPPG